ncbi:translation initiation factor IF-2 [Candidatus Berkelbacteria bacterium CG10_big_fil_rev_8_21_14_0_10_43_13]|uniref:Translation initiation factor IF-2 n=1 Tax=Candidatus Berkelbacteria bacterium CG10_big_fil_rev_8_21_14_0_10_43_13 TaxID=1974514 RepID=A0A2H0W8M0_9BACT|nr:MAG: translation initiation factor IF-2 [Candidatus Berkelbacteria bacterium CG10_big_fil_rev_8_21_14_0_10_43_13]
MEETVKKIQIPEVITVKDFAERANLSISAVISDLIKNGVMASINETIDFGTAEIIADDLGLEIEPEIETESIKTSTKAQKKAVAGKNLVHRPPVVTVMGHVDHGKTTLLDRIRETSVASGESGGITQHISAYQITLAETKSKELKNKTITFIDTPGHAAFSTMREHGTAITDIVVLIIATDDGVMPQTIEVIKQAQGNNVPLIVALNKTDLPDSDVTKVKQQLAEYDLVPEDWGGKTIMVEISAKTGKGVDSLLEMILLQAEVMDLKADSDEKAVGIVIESHMEKGAGPMVTLLVENGTLHRGEPIAIGSAYGKARILENYLAKTIEQAGPSTPVRIAGLKSLPEFGARLLAFSSEKEARESALLENKGYSSMKIATAKRITSEDDDTDSEKKELNLIIKADVAGSLEAIRKSLLEVKAIDYGMKIVAEGVGVVSDSDVTLAQSTGAIILGFRTTIAGAAKHLAEKEGITAKFFQVIYELIDFAKEELANTLPPEIIEKELGHGKVLAIFRDDKKGFVAGGSVDSGKLTVGDEIKFLQKNDEISRTTIVSLRREKNEVKESESGTECGFSLPAGAVVAVNDAFVAFKTIHKKRTIK